MEIGMGIHGEPGVERKNIEPADQIVDEMLEKILGDSVDFSGSEVAVMVNGMGGTPLMELYVAYAHVADVLEREGIQVFGMPYIGDYMTSLEMAGFSIAPEARRRDEALPECAVRRGGRPAFLERSDRCKHTSVSLSGL